MKSSGSLPMHGKVDVDETYVGGRTVRLQAVTKATRRLQWYRQKEKGKGVSRIYARVIETAGKENLQGFMKDHISIEANVRTDEWAGYKGIEKEFPHIVRGKSEKKELC